MPCTTFKYDDAQSVADLFDLKREGFFYTRLANPTVDAFEKKIAALEKGVMAVAVSSGQAANAFALMNIARSGDHILAVSSLYGGTVSLFTNTLKKAGIEITLILPTATEEELQAAIRPTLCATSLCDLRRSGCASSSADRCYRRGFPLSSRSVQRN